MDRIIDRKPHLYELYYIRAIAALGIFIIHGSGGFALYSPFNSKAMHIGILLNQFFRFGTPVFMIISGLVLFYNYSDKAKFNTVMFFKKKIIYVVIPYILWSVGYVLFRTYMYSLSVDKDMIITALRNLLNGKNFPHLYFIILIIQFYLLFPIMLRTIVKLMKNKPLKFLAALLIVQLSILCYGFYFTGQHTNTIISWIKSNYYMTLFGWFFYFLFGGTIALHYNRIVNGINSYIKIIIPLYVISTAVFIGEVYWNILRTGGRDYYEKFSSIRPINIFYSIMTLALLIWITTRIKEKAGLGYRTLKFVGTYSFGVYFVHPMVLEYIKIRMFQYFPLVIGYGRVVSIIVVLVCGIAITLGLCYLIGLSTVRWLLLGKVPQTNSKAMLKSKA